MKVALSSVVLFFTVAWCALFLLALYGIAAVLVPDFGAQVGVFFDRIDQAQGVLFGG